MPRPTQSTLLGAGAGLLSGLAASWIMSKFQSAISNSEQTQEQDEPANVKAAEKLAESTTGRDLTEPEKQAGGELMHYAMGGLSGAAYGALAPYVPIPSVAAGAIFGAAVWAIADEVAVPALKLSRPPAAYPVSTHASALAAHLVYGISTALLPPHEFISFPTSSAPPFCPPVTPSPLTCAPRSSSDSGGCAIYATRSRQRFSSLAFIMHLSRILTKKETHSTPEGL